MSQRKKNNCQIEKGVKNNISKIDYLKCVLIIKNFYTCILFSWFYTITFSLYYFSKNSFNFL